MNDRMNSLTFKMEKVYNMNKGPVQDVYKYFKSTFHKKL